ncbi:branched-chain amino acid ABC transporter substrate-binding protein [Streptomyces carminius]|uniref:Branched-chain amino acid ABC transporter substrate-binding protein n=1 Tax=Streptomyces carminius TaxID=2665496 RepID=A0A2M8M061_9ACTN|nr:ABC transporter substrate-binding protein [Streptomyces carminius]PJE97588.1 branched-chain amino acid ABC transporter substrate-binding protein [Streptomyces carminius]
MSTDAGIGVQQLLETLVQDFRAGDPPMPVIVLHAEDGEHDDQVTRIVDELQSGQRHHRTRYATIPLEQPPEDHPPGDPAEQAARLLYSLGRPGKWGDGPADYRPYAFPRLNLVRAIQEATDDPEMAEQWPTAPAGTPRGETQREAAQAQLLRILARQRWRPRKPPAWRTRLLFADVQQFLPMGLLAALTALLTRPEWYVVVAAGLGLTALLTGLNHVPGRAPLFLWLRRESKWFLTTTFLQIAARRQPASVRLLRPVRSWRAIATRAYDVAEALREGGSFQLQLCVLALFEDLRDNHRRVGWDLRGLKRTRPPMLFLSRISEGNGGVELIRAVSDIRSRRSELDPLLIVADVSAADAALLERGMVDEPADAPYAPPQFQQRLRYWYDAWAGNLRAGQSPSLVRALPWVLRIPLPADQLRELPEREWRCARARSRPSAARVLWSLHSLGIVSALVLTAGVLRAVELHEDHCSAGLLTANRHTEMRSGECVGIATGDVRFGKETDEPTSAVPWTIRELEEDIAAANRDAMSDDYVTVVYAGPLSSGKDEKLLPVKGAQELAGVHLAQRVINEKGTNNGVKLRVLVANGGADLKRQQDMARSIVEYAEKDPSLVGVVGLGRNLKDSHDTVRLLYNADLPVVSGTNSSTRLAEEFTNWFSLAATDKWQTEQLGLVVEQLIGPEKGPARQDALVLARDTEKTGDAYTEEQAKHGRNMLADTLDRPLGEIPRRHYKVDSGGPDLHAHAEEICRGGTRYSVIYFAGRVEDLESLVHQLDVKNCKHEMAILTGDDLSKMRQVGLPSNITIYHAALAELDRAAEGTSFYGDTLEYFGELSYFEGKPQKERRRKARPDSDVFANGQFALAHDATRALYSAATGDDEPGNSRAATWVHLRKVSLGAMATGTIDFTEAPLGKNREGQSIVLKKVTRANQQGDFRITVLCSLKAGEREDGNDKDGELRKLTREDCPIDRG